MRHPTEKSPAVPTGNRLSLFSRGLGWLRFRGPPSLQWNPTASTVGGCRSGPSLRRSTGVERPSAKCGRILPSVDVPGEGRAGSESVKSRDR